MNSVPCEERERLTSIYVAALSNTSPTRGPRGVDHLLGGRGYCHDARMMEGASGADSAPTSQAGTTLTRQSGYVEQIAQPTCRAR
jgi:hypothetical protein